MNMMIFLVGSKMFDALADNIDALTRIIPEVVGQIEAQIGQDKVQPAVDANLPLHVAPPSRAGTEDQLSLFRFWWDSSALC
jgi:hypothetical protein